MIRSTKLLLILLVAAMIVGDHSVSTAKSSKKIISYIRTWGLGSTREEINKGNYWSAKDIKADKVTTLNIAFAVINTNTKTVEEVVEKEVDGKKVKEKVKKQIKVADPSYDFTILNLKEKDGVPAFKNFFKELKKLQKKYPKTRFNLSIGGWGACGFSDMALTKKSRAKFIKNVLKWVKKYNFAGVDIDWEYPVNGGWGAIKARPEDKKNFTLVLKELKSALRKLGKKTKKRYEISFAGGASPDFVNKWIEAKAVAKYVDYVKIMSYDFAGPWQKNAAHHANLYSYKVGETAYDLSVDVVVKNYMKAGFPKHKILLGLPFYGRGWSGVENKNNGLGQKSVKAMYADGITYPDIMKLMQSDKSYKRYWDSKAKVPYLYNGDVWITYEDKQSINAKLDYVKKMGLKGIMIWEYSQDMSADLLTHINKKLK